MISDSTSNDNDWLSSLMGDKTGVAPAKGPIAAPAPVAQPAKVVVKSPALEPVSAPERPFDAAASVYILPGESKVAQGKAASTEKSEMPVIPAFGHMRRLVAKVSEVEVMRKVFSTVFALMVFAAGIHYGMSIGGKTPVVPNPVVADNPTPKPAPQPSPAIDPAPKPAVNPAPKPAVNPNSLPAATLIPKPVIVSIPKPLVDTNPIKPAIRVWQPVKHYFPTSPWDKLPTALPTTTNGLSGLTIPPGSALNQLLRDLEAKKAKSPNGR